MTAVVDEDLLAAFDESVRDVNEAILIPPLCYTSEEFFEFEKETIFGHDWLCIGHEGQIPDPGDYFTITFLDEPLIVVRGQDEQVRVMSAVCRHRGMVVAEGKGNCSSFRCPYHHWTYGTDGRLLGAAGMERRVGFDKSQYPLPSLPVELWNGFIFTSLDPTLPPVAPTLTSLDEVLRNFRLGEASWLNGGLIEGLPWNWKIMHENFNDGYHNNRLHKGIGDFIPCDKAVFLPFDDDQNHITRYNLTTHIDGSFTPQMKCLLPVFSGLTDEERWRSAFSLVPPSLALAIVPDQVAYFTILPKAAGEIDIQIGYLFDPKAMEEPLFDLLFEQVKAGVHNFNVQDIWADTMVQRGLRSRFAPRGPYSWQEETLQQFNRWLVKRYRSRRESTI
ncbi:MAG: aromatic ring-hydroxylating dioxygenase subunit alpha [Acidimicrobiia bacterium]